MILELDYRGSVPRAEVVEQALDAILGRKEPIIVGRTKKKKLTHYARVKRGFALNFADGQGLWFAVEHVRSRPKNRRRREIIEKNKESGKFAHTLFVHSKEKTTTVVHKIVDCVKTHFNAQRRRVDEARHAHNREARIRWFASAGMTV